MLLAVCAGATCADGRKNRFWRRACRDHGGRENSRYWRTGGAERCCVYCCPGEQHKCRRPAGLWLGNRECISSDDCCRLKTISFDQRKTTKTMQREDMRTTHLKSDSRSQRDELNALPALPQCCERHEMYTLTQCAFGVKVLVINCLRLCLSGIRPEADSVKELVAWQAWSTSIRQYCADCSWRTRQRAQDRGR